MSDESTLAKMLDTPKGKIVINSFVDELSQTNDVFKAYDKAVIVAKKEGILGVLQIGAGMDLLTILKYLAPIIIDQWRKNEKISQQGKRRFSDFNTEVLIPYEFNNFVLYMRYRHTLI